METTAGEKCLLCGSENLTAHSFGMRRCHNCLFFYLSPQKREESQAEFLPVANEPVKSEEVEELKTKYPKDAHGKRILYVRYADRVSQWYGNEVKALDVGASGGFFLNELEKKGASPSNLRTLEVEPVYQALTNEYFGYEGDISNIEDYRPADRKFDLVTMFDLLEHVNKFFITLDNVHELLSENGRLILKLPNGRWAYLKYRLAKLVGQTEKIPFYLYLKPGGHLNYWSIKNIERLCRDQFVLENFEYPEPTREQFRGGLWKRQLGHTLNRLFKLDLYPEMIVTLRKR